MSCLLLGSSSPQLGSLKVPYSRYIVSNDLLSSGLLPNSLVDQFKMFILISLIELVIGASGLTIMVPPSRIHAAYTFCD